MAGGLFGETEADRDRVWLVKGQHALAELFGVHVQTIKMWQAQGLPAATEPSRGTITTYDLRAVVQWRISALEERDEDGAPASGDSPAMERAKLRRMEAQAEKAEIDLKETKRELISREEIQGTWVNLWSRVKQLLESTTGCTPNCSATLREQITAGIARVESAAQEQLELQESDEGWPA